MTFSEVHGIASITRLEDEGLIKITFNNQDYLKIFCRVYERPYYSTADRELIFKKDCYDEFLEQYESNESYIKELIESFRRKRSLRFSPPVFEDTTAYSTVQEAIKDDPLHFHDLYNSRRGDFINSTIAEVFNKSDEDDVLHVSDPQDLGEPHPQKISFTRGAKAHKLHNHDKRKSTAVSVLELWAASVISDSEAGSGLKDLLALITPERKSDLAADYIKKLLDGETEKKARALEPIQIPATVEEVIKYESIEREKFNVAVDKHLQAVIFDCAYRSPIAIRQRGLADELNALVFEQDRSRLQISCEETQRLRSILEIAPELIKEKHTPRPGATVRKFCLPVAAAQFAQPQEIKANPVRPK